MSKKTIQLFSGFHIPLKEEIPAHIPSLQSNRQWGGHQPYGPLWESTNIPLLPVRQFTHILAQGLDMGQRMASSVSNKTFRKGMPKILTPSSLSGNHVFHMSEWRHDRPIFPSTCASPPPRLISFSSLLHTISATLIIIIHAWGAQENWTRAQSLLMWQMWPRWASRERPLALQVACRGLSFPPSKTDTTRFSVKKATCATDFLSFSQLSLPSPGRKSSRACSLHVGQRQNQPGWESGPNVWVCHLQRRGCLCCYPCFQGWSGMWKTSRLAAWMASSWPRVGFIRLRNGLCIHGPYEDAPSICDA